MLDNSFDIKYLEKNYKLVYDNLEHAYMNVFSDLAINMKKAFSDKITEDLKNGKIKSLVLNFVEMGERLLKICPERYKTSLKNNFTQEHITEIFYDIEWNDANKEFMVLILDTIIMFDSKENENENFKFKNRIEIMTLNNFSVNAPKAIIMINNNIDKLVEVIIGLVKD